MARGSDAAQAGANQGLAISDTSSGNASGLYGTLAPELEAEAAHPAGFAPSDLSAMNTATLQSGGGTQAAATGQGALLESRTGNKGSGAAAIGEGARSAGEQVSKGALGTQIANAKMKQEQQGEAQSGLEGLYNTNMGTSTGALGEVAQNVNANTNAENESWDWTKAISPFTSMLGGALSFIPKAKGGGGGDSFGPDWDGG